MKITLSCPHCYGSHLVIEGRKAFILQRVLNDMYLSENLVSNEHLASNNIKKLRSKVMKLWTNDKILLDFLDGHNSNIDILIN